MKPALSPQTTGVLSSDSTSAETSARTSGWVTTVRTTSTSFWTGAGLKKWTPTTRPGRAVAVEISVTDSEEVLVAMIASGPRMPSSSVMTARFTGSCSMTASTTNWQSLIAWRSVLKVMRSTSSLCSASLSLPRATARAVELVTCWRPRSRVSSSISTPTTS